MRNAKGFRPFNDALLEQKLIAKDQKEKSKDQNTQNTLLERIINTGVNFFPVWSTSSMQKTATMFGFLKKYQKLSTEEKTLQEKIIEDITKRANAIMGHDTVSSKKKSTLHDLVSHLRDYEGYKDKNKNISADRILEIIERWETEESNVKNPNDVSQYLSNKELMETNTNRYVSSNSCMSYFKGKTTTTEEFFHDMKRLLNAQIQMDKTHSALFY